MQISRHHRKRLHRTIAGLIVPALLALGCGDEVDTANIAEENVQAISIAAAEATSRGALASFMLMQLGYFLPFEGGESAAMAATAPSPGIVEPPPPDMLCDTGTSEIVFSETEEMLTTTYTECVLNEFPCFVDGVLEGRPVYENEEFAGFRVDSDGLSVECLGDIAIDLPNDRVTCNESMSGAACDVDLSSFDSVVDEKRIRVKELLLDGDIVFDEPGGDFDATGVASVAGEGEFEFETFETLSGFCADGLPSSGVVGVYGSGDAWAAIIFDDEGCEELEVCFFVDMEAEPVCEFVAYPGFMPPPI